MCLIRSVEEILSIIMRRSLFVDQFALSSSILWKAITRSAIPYMKYVDICCNSAGLDFLLRLKRSLAAMRRCLTWWLDGSGITPPRVSQELSTASRARTANRCVRLPGLELYEYVGSAGEAWEVLRDDPA